MPGRRPYANLGVKALEELVQNDPGLVDEVLAELGRRKVSAAVRLRKELEKGKVRTKASQTSGRRPASVKPRGDTQPRKALIVPEPQRRNPDDRIAFLRGTFTPEAELLARWGMTPEMPMELQRQVFELWRRRLEESGPDATGPTMEELKRDLKSLPPEK